MSPSAAVGCDRVALAEADIDDNRLRRGAARIDAARRGAVRGFGAGRTEGTRKHALVFVAARERGPAPGRDLVTRLPLAHVRDDRASGPTVGQPIAQRNACIAWRAFVVVVRVGYPTQSLIIKRIFERYRDGDGKHAIATLLNREGVPSAGAGGMRNRRPNSGTWSTASIKVILENEIYVGVCVWNRTSRKGEKHPTSGKKARAAAQSRDRMGERGGFRPAVR